MQQAQAQADAANYQAQVDRNNAIMAQQNAQDARRRGDQAQEEQQRKTAQIEGRQRAAFAANGIELTSGSPVDVLADTATFGELDRQTIGNNAEREARGYEAQRVNFNSSAGLNKMKADNASAAGSLGALSSLVNGGANVLRGGSALSGSSSVSASWFK